MAERASPDDPSFKTRWTFRLRRGFIPWLSRNPYAVEFHWRYQWVNKFCSGKDLLDIPAGMGWGTSLLEGARSLTGVDIDAGAIAEAKRRYGDKARFETGDMAKLRFDNETFDVVSCLEGIEHVPVEIGESFIRECWRVLRPGGLLLLSSPYCKNGAHSGNPYHIHEYTPQEITALLSSHFTIEKVIEKRVDIMTVLYLQCRKK